MLGYYNIVTLLKHIPQRRFTWCLLLVFLLVACVSGQNTSSNANSTSAPPSEQQTATGAVHAGPSPVTDMLAAAPDNCPTMSTLKAMNSVQDGEIFGLGPVWEVGLPPNATLHLDQMRYTQWPGTNIIWPISSNFPKTVTVHVKNVSTGEDAWWDIGGKEGGRGAPPPQQPVRPLVLDKSGNRVTVGGASDWGTLLYLPKAGCYSMQASWPGGNWHFFFAAGR